MDSQRGRPLTLKFYPFCVSGMLILAKNSLEKREILAWKRILKPLVANEGSSKGGEGQIASRTNREYWTLTGWVKGWANVILDPLSALLARLGVQPNVLSLIGLFIASAAGAVVAAGHITYGGLLFFLSGPFDALDGSLARIAGLETRFGAFLDSFIDRYSEAAVLFGILYWSSFQGSRILVVLTFLTLLGSLMVSYSRARAEALNISCKVGLFTRLERFIVLTLALLTKQLLIGLVILACLTNFTALQRMFHVYRQSLHQ